MSLASRGTSLLLSALFLSTSACPGPAATGDAIPVKQPDWGAPLVTLGGELRRPSGSTVSGPVRLALAWYPDMLSDGEASQPSQPRALVTEDLAYSGTFPTAYHFNVRTPPPSEALSPLGAGLRGNGALGILLAYRDGNGNGLLDTIPEDGTPIDRVVGASLEWSAPKAYAVLYVDTAQDASTGLKPGFNLVELSGLGASTLVPLNTPIPMQLSGAPALDAFVCQAPWNDSTRTERPCGIDLGENKPPPQEETLRVFGTMSLSASGAWVDFTISEESYPVLAAKVTVEGQPVTPVARTNQYRASLDAAALNGKTSVELRVLVNGKDVRRTLPIPGGFGFTAPAADARVASGTSLTAKWTASEGAQAYNLSLLKYDGSELTSTSTQGVEHTFGPRTYTGAATLRAEAVAWPQDNDRLGFIEVRRVLEQPVTLGTCEAPAESSLQAEGALEFYDDGAMVRLQVTQAGQSVTNAQVTFNGRPVLFVPQTGEYTLNLSGPWGRPTNGQLDVRVTAGGVELCRTVSIPGDFDILSPGAEGASVQSGTPFEVAWTQSAGARAYNVLVERSDMTPLASASTNALSYTFDSGVTYSGMTVLRAEAVAWPEGNAHLGALDVKRVRVQSLRVLP